MYRNSCSKAESVGDESPTGFDSIRTFHRVLNDEDGATNRQPAGGIVNPGLYTPSTGNKFFGGGRHY